MVDRERNGRLGRGENCETTSVESVYEREYTWVATDPIRMWFSSDGGHGLILCVGRVRLCTNGQCVSKRQNSEGNREVNI